MGVGDEKVGRWVIVDRWEVSDVFEGWGILVG